MNKTAWTIIGAVSFIGMVFAGIYCYPQAVEEAKNNIITDKTNNADLENQILYLQNQIKDLQNQITRNNQISPVIPDSDSGDNWQTYTSYDYGFTFEYQKPELPGQLMEFGSSSLGESFLRAWSLGVPETGTKWGELIVYKNNNLQTVVDERVFSLTDGPGTIETKNTLVISKITKNNLNFTVLKYHQEYADANVEERFTKLPNGYVISIYSWGWFKEDSDYRMLDSLRSI